MPAELSSKIGTDPNEWMPKWRLEGSDSVVRKAYGARVVDVARGVLLEAWKALKGSYWLTAPDGEELFGFVLPYLCTFTFESARERCVPRLVAQTPQYLLHGTQTSENVRRQRQLWVSAEDEGDRDRLWVAVMKMDVRLKSLAQEMQLLGGTDILVKCFRLLDTKGVEGAKRYFSGSERWVDGVCGILKTFDWLSRTWVKLSDNGVCRRLEDIATKLGVQLMGEDDFDVSFDSTGPVLTHKTTIPAASADSKAILRRLRTQDDWEVKVKMMVDDRTSEVLDDRLGYALEARINGIVDAKLNIGMEEKMDSFMRKQEASLKDQQMKSVMLLSEHKRKLEEKFSAILKQVEELKNRIVALEKRIS